MKRLLISITVISLSISAAVQADEFGQVVSKIPITQQVTVPQQVCQTQQVLVQQPRSAGGAILGGITGNLLGATIGHGDGRSAARIVGTVLGAAVGDNIDNANNQPQLQNVQSCNTVQTYQSQIVGYNVTYRYAGQLYNTQLSYDPGNRVPVQVTAGNNVQQPVYQAQPVVTVQTGVPVIYAQPAPVFVPEISIQGVWSNDYHRHWDDDHHWYDDHHWNNYHRWDNRS